MAQLAIKGHATRGKEVIEILEMLGGKNEARLNGTYTCLVYYICLEGYIDTLFTASGKYKVFTPEEFLEKFPYKVGDKVLYKTYGIYSAIKSMKWNSEKEQVFYRLDSKNLFVATVDELKPCKEETMENKLGQITLDIPDGYKFYGINDDNKVVLTKIQPKYPKTYEECCELLMGKTNFSDFSLVLTKFSIRKNEENSISPEPPYISSINTLYKLLICRDAYWKIAGEQMGLGKPWEPYWTIYKHKFCLGTDKDKVIEECVTTGNRILAFPTSEMRDAFKENFDGDIDTCKEFL